MQAKNKSSATKPERGLSASSRRHKMARHRRNVVCIFLLQILLSTNVQAEIFPDNGQVRTKVAYFSEALRTVVEKASGLDTLVQVYDSQNDMQFTKVNGDQMVETLTEQLDVVLAAKMRALERSVKWAEDVARNYTWNPDFQIGDVQYIAAKKINASDPAYEYHSLFQQKVNFENSSVHIPVEIYEGDINILNGLSWTDRLDEQWKRNREMDDNLLWQYFGSQTGIMRNFPASKWRETGSVDLYDVRRRPWYTQGASSPKDMLILVDTSGSTYGQALSLMRQAVFSLLDTLGENDFVNVAHFSEGASWIGCFKTFVQATYRNKQELRTHVESLGAKGMANYKTGLEFAFQQFREFEKRENTTDGLGAACNRIIMFLTDGGTERPKEIFEEYNPDKSIRIFAYAVGPTANPISAVKWLACANRGYFYRVPAMGAIRSTVQEHVSVITRPMALQWAWYSQWSNIYSDALSHHVGILSHQLDGSFLQFSAVYFDNIGLGMMTTVTLPVYNTTLVNDVKNQTILGVMGCDVTVSEMEQFVPLHKLGPNGYAFAINSNGYIVFHPNLKSTRGWLANPPNVDFLDVELETPAKVELRKKMIDQEQGSQSIGGFIFLPDERHLDNVTRTYHYMSLDQSNFSIAIVLPDYVQYYLESVTPMDQSQGLAYLTKKNTSAVLLADWEFCPNVTQQSNISTWMEDLLYQIENIYPSCDADLLQKVFFDAKVTETMDSYWTDPRYQPQLDYVTASFISTVSGLTRIFPASEEELMEGRTDPWEELFFKRALDNKEEWMFSVPYHQGGNKDPNATEPVVTVSKTLVMNNNFRPAVAGVIMSQEKLREILMKEVTSCKHRICYLVDDGGFLILSNQDGNDHDVGRFLGEMEPSLMDFLVNRSVFTQHIMYDFQAACPDRQEIYNAGPRTVALPVVFEMLTLKWWTAKFAWFYLNFNLYEWIFAPISNFVYAATEVYDLQDGKKYRILETNHSCIKKLAQYQMMYSTSTDMKKTFVCGNCSRTFASARVTKTNLLLVMVDHDCYGDCTPPVLPQAPERSEDPAYPGDGTDSDVVCTVKHRYRKRPPCFDYSASEDDDDCGTGAQFGASWTLLLAHLLAICFVSICQARL